MAIHLGKQIPPDCPPEPTLLHEVSLRLITDAERARFDELLEREHYLHNPTAVGAVLRYVAEARGQWLALLVFSSPALHLKPRDRWLHWSARDVPQRRHLLAQNSRFLILAAPACWPNLASRVLKLVCARLSEDWQQQFGHPILAVETFVDPQRFRGTSYRAAGWQPLGLTAGLQRDWQDFYTDTEHPKQIWVRALSPRALAQLRAPGPLPAALSNGQSPPPPPCPVPTAQLPSLLDRFRQQLTDPRHAKGRRHALATILALVALAVAAGCKGPHAIAEFAASLHHGQRHRLRCRPRPGKPRQFDVPGERTFRRVLQSVEAESLKDVLVAWMAAQQPAPPRVVHLDGKVIKNAAPAPACGAPSVPSEIPADQQKPKADRALTLVNFVTARQQLLDPVAVPRDTNEEAAVAAHWPGMDLAGCCVTADAAHTTKANARQLTFNNGADYFFFLKANQPHALAKAQQLLPGSFPPSGAELGQRARARGGPAVVAGGGDAGHGGLGRRGATGADRSDRGCGAPRPSDQAHGRDGVCADQSVARASRCEGAAGPGAGSLADREQATPSARPHAG
jgi:hypothetical protein